MKARPILFSGPMVRALLDDTKSQTRRVAKFKPRNEGLNLGFSGLVVGHYMTGVPKSGFVLCSQGSNGWSDKTWPLHSPYGLSSDRLWVRETFFAYGRWETRFNAKKGRDEWHFVDMTIECDRIYQYAADAPDVPLAENRGGVLPGWWKRPAIFMPRSASRITLDIGNVRIERLKKCSDQDAEAEGIAFLRDVPDADETLTPRQLFMCLWDSINGDGAWDANPWVWVVEFKRIAP